MLRVSVKQGSLTDGEEHVLVNASNTGAKLGSGVSGAIRAACGAGYQERVLAALHARYGGPMSPGAVLVTDAGSHPHARFVAHVAVMDYRQGFTGDSFPTLALIEGACRELWVALEALGERELSVAMVALGAGTGRLGARDTTRVACETLKAHVASTPGSAIAEVVFYGYELPGFLAMADAVSRVFELPAGALSDEVREYLARMRAEEG